MLRIFPGRPWMYISVCCTARSSPVSHWSHSSRQGDLNFKTNRQIPGANIKGELRARAIAYEISDSSGISIGLEKKDAARVAGRAERQAVKTDLALAIAAVEREDWEVNVLANVARPIRRLEGWNGVDRENRDGAISQFKRNKKKKKK
ncbi:hypothetical protein GX48_02738 [Paracoccidioides brasiliensis]|nr:hypothetical protein GX48_02738 [Paracoccidioides brasiliensis]